jgi:hypothetical protein
VSTPLNTAEKDGGGVGDANAKDGGGVENEAEVNEGKEYGGGYQGAVNTNGEVPRTSDPTTTSPNANIATTKPTAATSTNTEAERKRTSSSSTAPTTPHNINTKNGTNTNKNTNEIGNSTSPNTETKKTRRVSLKNKILGEAKVIAGKLGGKGGEGKVEEGRRILRGE